MQSELKKIINKVKKGDQRAFRLLVEQHQKYAYNLAFRLLCDEEEARDAVQDSFIKIWQKITDYKIELKFTTWMYKIVTNTAIDRLRSIKRLNLVQLEDVSEKLEKMNEQGFENQMDNKETGQLIRLISEGLPQKQRLVFVLRDIQGLGSAEVENILSLPETSIKSNLYHARKMIREKLTKIMAYERRVK